MKIVVLSSRFPYPLERGDKLRLFHQMRILSTNHELHLISITDRQLLSNDLDSLKPYCKEIYTYTISTYEKVKSVLSMWWRGRPLQLGINYCENTHKEITHKIHQIRPDLVYCQLFRMAPYCIDLKFPKVLDFMDAFGKGMARRAEVSNYFWKMIYKFEAKRVMNFERELLYTFDAFTIISEQDRALITTNSIDVNVVSNGIDTNFFRNTNTDEPAYDIAFTGNLGYLPNVDASKLLLGEISKLYKKKTGKDLRIVIAGARPDASLKRMMPNHCLLLPWIQDIREAYQSAKIFVAPLFYGTGQQNKILEAMSMGLPCITTSAVNNAIGGTPNQHIIIADTIEEFVNQIELLLLNKELRMMFTIESRLFVEENFQWKNAVNKLNDIIITTNRKYNESNTCKS